MSEKQYSEKEIRKAVWELNKKYQNWIEKMDFHDMLLIENVLMNFEMILFNGDVQSEELME